MWRAVVRQTTRSGKPVTMTDGRPFKTKAVTRCPPIKTGQSCIEPSPMTADKSRYLDLRLPDRALRKTTIKSNCSGAIVALQAKKVNRNLTDRHTERGMVPNPSAMGNQQLKGAGLTLTCALRLVQPVITRLHG